MSQHHMTDKELILLKMKIIYSKAQKWSLEELTFALDLLSSDAWEKTAKNYPTSLQIDG